MLKALIALACGAIWIMAAFVLPLKKDADTKKMKRMFGGMLLVFYMYSCSMVNDLGLEESFSRTMVGSVLRFAEGKEEIIRLPDKVISMPKEGEEALAQIYWIRPKADHMSVGSDIGFLYLSGGRRDEESEKLFSYLSSAMVHGGHYQYFYKDILIMDMFVRYGIWAKELRMVYHSQGAVSASRAAYP